MNDSNVREAMGHRGSLLPAMCGLFWGLGRHTGSVESETVA